MYSKSAETRRLLLEQAAVLMNRKGFAATSIQDITEATGFTKGALYGHFSDKESLTLEVLAYNTDFVLDGFSFLRNSGIGFWDKFDRIGAFYRNNGARLSAGGGCPFLNSAIELDDQPSSLRQKLTEAFHEWEQLFVCWLDQGKQEGVIRHDVESQRYTRLFVAMLEGAVMIAHLHHDHSPLQMVLGQIRTICTADLKP